MSMNLDEDELVDTVGKNIESLIALIVSTLGGLVDNFGVANEIVVGGTNYRYQFMFGREGERTYKQLDRQFKKAGLDS